MTAPGSMANDQIWHHVARHDATHYTAVSRHAKLLQRILDARADASIDFDGLRGLLRHLGFAERIRGRHHVFHRDDVMEIINLQRDRANAKTYQVRQVRAILRRYVLGTERGDA